MMNFKSRYLSRWKECSNNKHSFEKKYHQWLEMPILSEELKVELAQLKKQMLPGRPSKNFEDLCPRGQRNRTTEIRNKYTKYELLSASSSIFGSQKSRAKSKIIQTVSHGSPTTLKRMQNAIQQHSEKTEKCSTPERALTLYIDNKMTVEQYNNLRSFSTEHYHELFPPYAQLKEAKLKTYPEGIHVCETFASIPLQNLLDHTIERIILTMEYNFKYKDYNDFCLITKYGMDGSTGFNCYKHRGSNDSIIESLFQITLVPLRLVAKNHEGNDEIIWNNPRPSSTRLCRPIRFMFEKETPELIERESTKLEREIDHLKSSSIQTGKTNINVNHQLIFCMIDGKIAQVLTNTSSSQVCIICGAKPSEMNNLSIIFDKKIDINSLQYGISPLHSYIRFYECILHISYRLDFKKWRVSKTNEKKLFEERKRQLRIELREKLGLIVDVPCSGGSGTSNDGNSARVFFEEFETSSSITGINMDLIRRFGVILKAINLQFDLDNIKFENYCKETASIFVKHYNWYHMPRTVHQVLIHDHEIIQNFSIPIGLTSEESQEALNKHYKYLREHNTRKMNPKTCNEDLIHHLLMSSDPLITSMRKSPKYNKKDASKLSDELFQLSSS